MYDKVLQEREQTILTNQPKGEVLFMSSPRPIELAINADALQATAESAGFGPVVIDDSNAPSSKVVTVTANNAATNAQVAAGSGVLPATEPVGETGVRGRFKQYWGGFKTVWRENPGTAIGVTVTSFGFGGVFGFGIAWLFAIGIAVSPMGWILAVAIGAGVVSAAVVAKMPTIVSAIKNAAKEVKEFFTNTPAVSVNNGTEANRPTQPQLADVHQSSSTPESQLLRLQQEEAIQEAARKEAARKEAIQEAARKEAIQEATRKLAEEERARQAKEAAANQAALKAAEAQMMAAASLQAQTGLAQEQQQNAARAAIPSESGLFAAGQSDSGQKTEKDQALQPSEKKSSV